MKNYLLFIFIATISNLTTRAQQRIKLGSTPFNIQNTSILELESTDKALLLPRLTNTQAANILTKAKNNNASGLTLYNTDCKCIQVFDASTTTGRWVSMGSSSTTSWSLTGNYNTTPSSNFIGTTDNTDLIIKTNNTERIKIAGGGGADFANQTIKRFSANITQITSVVYTLSSEDNGSIITFDNTNNIIVTVPINLPSGFNVICYQMNIGTITFTPADGVTILQRANSFTTAGQYANASLVAVQPNRLILSGDLN